MFFFRGAKRAGIFSLLVYKKKYCLDYDHYAGCVGVGVGGGPAAFFLRGGGTRCSATFFFVRHMLRSLGIVHETLSFTELSRHRSRLSHVSL